MTMHNPPHAGKILKAIYLEPLELTITETADALGITRQTLSELINEKTSVSIDMALRLGKAFNTSPEMWLNLQTQHDLWHARKRDLSDVQRIVD